MIDFNCCFELNKLYLYIKHKQTVLMVNLYEKRSDSIINSY